MERFLAAARPRKEQAAAAAEAALAKGAELARFLGEDPAKTDPNALLLTVWQFATAYDAALGALRRREAVARAKAGGAGAR
jgi:hypothetical protein